MTTYSSLPKPSQHFKGNWDDKIVEDLYRTETREADSRVIIYRLFEGRKKADR